MDTRRSRVYTGVVKGERWSAPCCRRVGPGRTLRSPTQALSSCCACGEPTPWSSGGGSGSSGGASGMLICICADATTDRVMGVPWMAVWRVSMAGQVVGTSSAAGALPSLAVVAAAAEEEERRTVSVPLCVWKCRAALALRSSAARQTDVRWCGSQSGASGRAWPNEQLAAERLTGKEHRRRRQSRVAAHGHLCSQATSRAALAKSHHTHAGAAVSAISAPRTGCGREPSEKEVRA